MKWEGHVEHVGEKGNVFRNFMVKTEQKHLEDLSTDWTKILKWILKKQEGIVWTGLTYLRMGTQADCVNTMINIWVTQNAGNCSTS